MVGHGQTMVSPHEIKTAMLVDLDLSTGHLPPGASFPGLAPAQDAALAPQLPLNLRSMKKRLSHVLPWQRAPPRQEDEDDPFGLRTLKPPSLPRQDTQEPVTTPIEPLIRVDDSPPGSDNVFHSGSSAPGSTSDRGTGQVEPLTDWTRLQLEAQSIAGTIREAQATPLHRCLNWDSFSPVAGHHSPLTWEDPPPVGQTPTAQPPVHAQPHWELVASSPDHSPLRPLRLPPPQSHVKENAQPPDPVPRTRASLSFPAEPSDDFPPGLGAPLSQARVGQSRKCPLGSAKPPLKPRNAGLARRDPGLTSSSRRLSSSMGALPGSKPVTRPPTSTRPPRPPPPSIRTKPPLAEREAAPSSSTRAGPLRRSLISTPRATPATPLQASHRRSMLATPVNATPVNATPRRSMLATPTFSRAKPPAGSTPATVTKGTPVIKSRLSVVKPQLRPRGLGPQLSTLTPRVPRAPPLTGPRPLGSRAPPSKGALVTRPQRRISGLPSPLRKNPQ